MICPKCGSKNMDGSTICINCGTNIKEANDIDLNINKYIKPVDSEKNELSNNAEVENNTFISQNVQIEENNNIKTENDTLIGQNLQSTENVIIPISNNDFGNHGSSQQYSNYGISSNNNENNSKKSKFIVIILILLILIGIGTYFLFLKPKDDKKPNKEGTSKTSEKDTTKVKENEKNQNTNSDNSNITEATNYTKEKLKVLILSTKDDVDKFLSNLMLENNTKKLEPEYNELTGYKYFEIDYHLWESDIMNKKYSFYYFNDDISLNKATLSVLDYDGIIILTSNEKLDLKTKENLEKLNKIGVKNLAVYINTKENENSEKLINLKEKISSDLINIGFSNDSLIIYSGNQKNLKEFTNKMTDVFGKINDDEFFMPIEDVFTIPGRGTIVTGRIGSGQLKVNDEVEIVGLGETKKTVVTSIEKYRNQLDFASVGDNVGLALKDITQDEVERGQVMVSPGTIGSHTKFKAQVYMFLKDEGGRKTPIEPNYHPNFYINGVNTPGEFKFSSDYKNVEPGTFLEISVELEKSIAIRPGARLWVTESGRSVGKGIITEILD